jgi:hypothetical protein
MALFTLTDISFSKNNNVRKGRASTNLVGGGYENNIFRYPEDIGNYDKGHYMVIHINEQVRTQKGGQTIADDPTIISNRKRFGTPSPFTNLGEIAGNKSVNSAGKTVVNYTSDMVNRIASKDSSGILSGLVQGGGSLAEKAFENMASVNGVRTIRRTTDTIALYMPDTMNFVHQQQYSEASLTGLPAAVLAGGASAAQSLKGNNNAKDVAKSIATNLSPFLAGYALNQLGDIGRAAFAAGFGMVQNPILELLYTSPSFRSFRFDFAFYPRSEQEAKEVQNILQRLRFHQAPEIRKESNGFFLVPPSEFDIKFYYNGAENPNIPSISTCVLETIDIDYAPNGFSTYEVPGQTQASVGETGMPVGIKLTLQFKETEILTKDNFPSNNLSKQTQEMSSEWNKTGAVNKNGEGLF